MRVLVAGARGFIGRALCPALERAGHEVVRGVRPDFDVDDDAKVRAALRGCDAAVWLVHGLKRSPTLKQRALARATPGFLRAGDAHDYATWEQRTAARFADLAREQGVRRIVYLGGIDPRTAVGASTTVRGDISKHLEARLRTGEALRASGAVPVVELRAAMIVGAGSESWFLARDGAARLPAFLAPPWLQARTQPVALDDVVAALVASVDQVPPGVYDAPGPEVLTGRQVVERTLALLGRRAEFLEVPLFPRRVASFFAPFVTRANANIARELFQGVGFDLVVAGDGVFEHMPHHRRLSFDEAARRALADDEVKLTARLYEAALRALRPASRA